MKHVSLNNSNGTTCGVDVGKSGYVDTRLPKSGDEAAYYIARLVWSHKPEVTHHTFMG